MNTFAGQVEVAPQDFEANFERLIVKDGNVSFRLVAREPDGDNWWLEGSAAEISGGSYNSGALTMNYRSGQSCKAQVRFQLDLSSKEKCGVRVRFEQYEQDEEAVWFLAGELSPFVANTGVA